MDKPVMYRNVLKQLHKRSVFTFPVHLKVNPVIILIVSFRSSSRTLKLVSVPLLSICQNLF